MITPALCGVMESSFARLLRFVVCYLQGRRQVESRSRGDRVAPEGSLSSSRTSSASSFDDSPAGHRASEYEEQTRAITMRHRSECPILDGQKHFTIPDHILARETLLTLHERAPKWLCEEVMRRIAAVNRRLRVQPRTTEQLVSEVEVSRAALIVSTHFLPVR